MRKQTGILRSAMLVRQAKLGDQAGPALQLAGD